MLKRKYYTGEQIHEAIDGVVGDYKKAIEIYWRLAKMETDDVQLVKHGKWEDVEADEGEWICFKCSVCGHDAYSYAGEILSNEWKFCPYCGAKMDEVEE